jgi:hypothetical protein
VVEGVMMLRIGQITYKLLPQRAGAAAPSPTIR